MAATDNMAEANYGDPPMWPTAEPYQPVWPWRAGENRRASEVFDVRVSQPNDPRVPWPGEVSLRDVLAASLVTFDKDIEPENGDWEHPIQPKAVYVRYQGIDPVTRITAPVLVPAELCLDVYADPNFQWSAPVIEEESEEDEETVAEESNRRKLKSSIRGDPILRRAKPAQVADPYFAPLHPEMLVPPHRGVAAIHAHAAAAANANQKLTTATATSGGFDFGGGGGGGASLSMGGSKQKVTPKNGAGPQDSGTLNSFLKAQGRDKYGRSRLHELDHILAATSSAAQASRSQRAWEDISTGLPPLSLETMDSMREASQEPMNLAGLTSHLAYHIGRIPKKDCNRRPKSAAMSTAKTTAAAEEDASAGGGSSADEDGEDGPNSESGAGNGNGNSSQNASGPGPSSPEGAMSARTRRSTVRRGLSRASVDEDSRQISRVRRASSCATTASGLGGSPNAATDRSTIVNGRSNASRRSVCVATERGQRNSVASIATTRAPPPPPTKAKKKMLPPGYSHSTKLRDLDPHLPTEGPLAPSQRLHGNWPERVRRQLARHFYGMTTDQMVDEELKERLKDRKNKVPEADTTPDDDVDSSAGSRLSPDGFSHDLSEKRALERRILQSTAADKVPYTVEIRIKNSQRGTRCVVTRYVDGDTGDTVSGRPTLLLDELQATRKRISRKY